MAEGRGIEPHGYYPATGFQGQLCAMQLPSIILLPYHFLTLGMIRRSKRKYFLILINLEIENMYSKSYIKQDSELAFEEYSIFTTTCHYSIRTLKSKFHINNRIICSISPFKRINNTFHLSIYKSHTLLLFSNIEHIQQCSLPIDDPIPHILCWDKQRQNLLNNLCNKQEW